MKFKLLLKRHWGRSLVRDLLQNPMVSFLLVLSSSFHHVDSSIALRNEPTCSVVTWPDGLVFILEREENIATHVIQGFYSQCSLHSPKRHFTKRHYVRQWILDLISFFTIFRLPFYSKHDVGRFNLIASGKSSAKS